MLMLLVLAWGFAEATVFFIVPDIIISFVGLKYGLKRGLAASCMAAFGAVLGGLVIYFWGKADITSAHAFFDLLPAIAPTTIERAHTEIGLPSWSALMLKGSLTGVPFKLYASEAGAAGLPLWQFVLASPIVRLPRFLVAATLGAVAKKFCPEFLKTNQFRLLASFWVLFYVAFWLRSPW
jgi:membrane protein YqaA with SNARE-associated domain